MARPSRQQRLTEAEATARDKLELQQKAHATIQGQLRALEKKARDRRRYQVGLLAEHCGLVDLDDAALRPLFQMLAGVTRGSSPVAMLEALLKDLGATPGTSVDASGETASRAATPCQLGVAR
jgi:hypothetical protein